MSSDPFDPPDPVVVPDVQLLVDRYLPEVRPTPAVDRPSAYFGATMLGFILALGLSGMVGWVAATVIGVVIALVGGLYFEMYRKRSLAEFDRIIRDRPWELYGRIADRFRDELASHRARLMGPASEWGRARAPLEEALHESRRSEAYWEERMAQDPDQPMVRDHRDTARALSEKFHAALSEVDRQHGILLDFFNACEAKLVALESSKRDVEESRRLARLSDRAEDVTLDAQFAMAAMGREVLVRALQLGEALGAADRLRIQHAAGDVDVDQIEVIADRILESAESERRELARLVSSVEGTDPQL